MSPRAATTIFFFNDTATTEIYTLSLHDALPISAGDQQVVEGGAARRLHRLQPERQGPHRRLGLLGAPHRRRARFGAAALGGGRRLRTGRLHAAHPARALREAWRSGGRDRPRGGVAAVF